MSVWQSGTVGRAALIATLRRGTALAAHWAISSPDLFCLFGNFVSTFPGSALLLAQFNFVLHNDKSSVQYRKIQLYDSVLLSPKNIIDAI